MRRVALVLVMRLWAAVPSLMTMGRVTLPSRIIG